MSILEARDIINEQQLLLPGYTVTSTFFDDGCRGDQAVRMVLEEMAGNDNYVGIGGLGCNDVCGQVSVVASSMRVPLVSYDCAADYLTDAETYPNFVRFGTVTSYAKVILVQFARQYSWPSIEVVYTESFVSQADAQNGPDTLENWIQLRTSPPKSLQAVRSESRAVPVAVKDQIKTK